MSVRLAGGVVAGRGLKVWRRADGACVDAAYASPALGAPVAVGPADAGEDRVAYALDELAKLPTVAAGAGVDLGGGFVSARLDGARGDRRDAVLAALRVLGLDGAGRLGDRAAVLVALFGPAATKRVGAAATGAIAEGRWAAVHLASAASDVLGPEQLERVLALAAPDGVDPCPQGTPSALAADLGVVFGQVPRPRRLDLVVDLWSMVCAEQARALRRQRLLRSQSGQDRVDDLRSRYQHLEDEHLLAELRSDVGPEPALAQAARWIPTFWYWRDRWMRLVRDAVSATVLLRVAVSVADHGVTAGLARCRQQLAAAVALGELPPRPARRVPGLTGLPAVPGWYVRDLHGRADPAPAFVAQRLARARDYGTMLLRAIDEAAREFIAVQALPQCGFGDLRAWRAAAGYTAVRQPGEWEQPSLSGSASLAQRLRDRAGAEPSDVETIGDLLWYADLADALAQLHGHDAATLRFDDELPDFDVDPVAEPAPLSSRTDSIAAAAAVAAQLVSLGARLSGKPRTWTAMVGELLASAAVAEALTGEFPVPAPLRTVDGATVPGTGARIELARTPRQLADWSAFMGNCIAGEYYLEEAAAGKCGLAAVRGRGGSILANVDLRPARQGWRIHELRTRFNGFPDEELAQRLTDWVATIEPPAPPAAPRPRRVVHGRGGRPGRYAGSRLLRDVGETLTRLAEEALADPETTRAAQVLAVTAAGTDAHAALTALRRAGSDRLADIVRLSDVEIAELWAAAGVRPLAAALARLDPDPRLDALLADAALPRSLRRLARRPGVAAARTMDLVGQRVRRVIGRMTREGDPILAAKVATHPSTGMICALALAVTAWPDRPPVTAVTRPRAVTVPGFPASSLTDPDGPWQRAWPDARELGAGPEPCWDQVARTGLQVPTAWLGPGGWPALWRRANRG